MNNVTQKNEKVKRPVYKRKYLWRIIYGIALAGYTAFALLDAFVMPKNVVAMDNAYGSSNTESDGANEETNASSGESSGSGTKIVTDNSYIRTIFLLQLQRCGSMIRRFMLRILL